MSTLTQKISRLIEATGSISVAEYMALCLYDSEHGYYTTREPFGGAGDFTTAPEISQMFGELVGVWLYAAWQACNAPRNAVFAEIGPGRGTLMKDMLRTFGKLDPTLLTGHRFALVETSPRLAAVQKKTLAGAQADLKWHTRVEDLPGGALFIVGNEIFDAVPIRQYVKTEAGWRERAVGLAEDGSLAFAAGPSTLPSPLLPPGADEAANGAIFEIAPAREALMEAIAARLARTGGAGMFIDYGYEGPSLGDTLQAVRRHSYDGVLANPGEADLTAHVDFVPLAEIARVHGLEAQLMPQGEFLIGLGLLERAGRLGAGRTKEEQEQIRTDVERLAGPDQMGNLFKVLGVLPPGVAVPPFQTGQ